MSTFTSPPARRAWQSMLSYERLGLAVGIFDFCIIVTFSVVAASCYQLVVNDQIYDVYSQFSIGVVAGFVYWMIAGHFGLYSSTTIFQQRAEDAPVLFAWVLAILLSLLLLFLLKLSAELSRGSMISFGFAAGLSLLIWRRMLKWWLRGALARSAVTGRRVMLIGTEAELCALNATTLLEFFGLFECGRVIVSPRLSGDVLDREESTRLISQALDQIRAVNAQEIILALPWGNSTYLDFIREQLRISPLPVRLLPDQYVRSVWTGYGPGVARQSLIDVQRSPLTHTELVLKRTFDLVFGSLILIVLFPLLLLTGLAIALDSRGPVIFRQRRRGFNGRDFVIYKFRTMRVMEDGEVIKQAAKSDPRVTRLGRLLRRSSIDELPQLLNVLEGNMSLVGPRPHPVALDKEYGALLGKYALRHHVKPGITGWAQVNGFRGETAHVTQMERRVEFDIWYINNWSLVLDVKILLRTFFAVSGMKNAY